MFAAKIYNIPDLNDLLKTLIPNDVSAVCILLFPFARLLGACNFSSCLKRCLIYFQR